ncbi:MAG: hypothetical protein ACK55Z_18415 [bacterium]
MTAITEATAQQHPCLQSIVDFAVHPMKKLQKLILKNGKKSSKNDDISQEF